MQGYKAPFEGIQLIIGMRWSAGPIMRRRDFLSRNRIPFTSGLARSSLLKRCRSLLQDKGARRRASCRSSSLAMGHSSRAADHDRSWRPSASGTPQTQAKQEFYDVVVVGAGSSRVWRPAYMEPLKVCERC